MKLDNFLPNTLVNESVDTRRRARLLLYAVGITNVAGLLAALMMVSLGYQQTAITISYTLLWQSVGLAILFISHSVKIAGHYLTFAIFLEAIWDFGPASEFSILALNALPILAINLLNLRAGIIWSLFAVVWAGIVNPWLNSSNDFLVTLSHGTAITTLALCVASAVVEIARGKAVDEAEKANKYASSLRQRLWTFAEQTFPGIAEVRSETFEYVNPGLCALLGYPEKELMHLKIESLIHPDDYTNIFKTLVGTSSNGFRIEARARHNDGYWLWLELFGIPYGTPDENRWIIASRDYSDEKQSRERLMQAQRLEGVGVLAAGVAHDFNNLLTVIMGFGDILPPSLERNEILNAAKSAAELTSQLMAFGQRSPVAGSSLDAVSAMAELEALFKSLLGARISLSLVLPGSPLGIKIGANQFNQVVLNLVKNAKESISDSGQIEIKVSTATLSKSEALSLSITAEECVLVSVSDNGIGMSEKTAERAFDPFYSTKEPGRGSGLGLASTHGIVHQQGGGVKLISNEGVGTTITLYFPLAPLNEDASRVVKLNSQLPSGSGLKILVVDDEKNIRDLVGRILKEAGHNVSIVGNARDAIKIFESSAFDLVVCDIVMAGIRGTELVEKLRLNQPELPALFISGYTREDVDLWVESDVPTMFLAKPFRGEELLSQIRKLHSIPSPA